MKKRKKQACIRLYESPRGRLARVEYSPNQRVAVTNLLYREYKHERPYGRYRPRNGCDYSSNS